MKKAFVFCASWTVTIVIYTVVLLVKKKQRIAAALKKS